jgi:hypothetical protein
VSQDIPFRIGSSVQPLVRSAFGPSGSTTTQIGNSEPCVDITALNALALRSLTALFDARENLFSRSLTLTKDGFYREKTSRRRTMIALLGLQRLADSGGPVPIDIAAVRDATLTDNNWVRSLGDLGLLTWLTAEIAPERLTSLFDEFDFGKALESYPDGRQAHNGGLALFLAGISHAQLAGDGSIPDLTDVAVDVYHLLLENQGESGIFGQSGFARSPQRVFCRRFGTFGDQIYAIYALSTFAKAFQVEEPLASALSCANSIRALQGEKGEWWFLYDKGACRVVNRYPVFSWHQDGTAPLGLLALGEATGQSFQEAIHKGLSWITGLNELGNDLRNLERGLIWDSICPKRPATNYWETALSLLNMSRRFRQVDLHIRQEARPDHFGWLLYAFGKQGLAMAPVAAHASARR